MRKARTEMTMERIDIRSMGMRTKILMIKWNKRVVKGRIVAVRSPMLDDSYICRGSWFRRAISSS